MIRRDDERGCFIADLPSGLVKFIYDDGRIEFARPATEKAAVATDVAKGDLPGHPFRGNQYVDGEGEGGSPDAPGDRELVHGTDTEFDRFEAGEFGFHFGDDAAAANRSGGVKIRARLDIKNPLRTSDLGVWDPEAVAREAWSQGVLDDEEFSGVLADVEIERERLKDRLDSERGGLGETDESILDSRRAHYEMSRPVREALKEKGYDGIVYRNEAEGYDDSYIAFDDAQIHRSLTERATGRDLKANRDSFAAAAQRVYDAWDENPDEYAGGGICHLIAEEIAGGLNEAGIEATTQDNGGVGEQHVWTVARAKDGVYLIDIPPGVYETGGGYSWTKKQGVKFDAGHVVVERLDSDPDRFEDYIERAARIGDVAKGEGPGHPFRGNQWTDGEAGPERSGFARAPAIRGANAEAIRMEVKRREGAHDLAHGLNGAGKAVDHMLDAIYGNASGGGPMLGHGFWLGAMERAGVATKEAIDATANRMASIDPDDFEPVATPERKAEVEAMIRANMAAVTREDVSALRAIATVSQAMYREKNVTLYRGVSAAQGKEMREGRVTLDTDAMAWFSESREDAEGYAAGKGSVVVEVEVPRSAILYSHRAFNTPDNEVLVATSGRVRFRELTHKAAVATDVAKGEGPGHPFRGNQYTTGESGGGASAPAGRRGIERPDPRDEIGEFSAGTFEGDKVVGAVQKYMTEFGGKGTPFVLAEEKRFTLNGKSFTYAGSCSMKDGQITIYPNAVRTFGDMKQVVAHEVAHQKFRHVLAAIHEERERVNAKVMNPTGPDADFWTDDARRKGLDPDTAIMHPSGELTPRGRKEYPITAALWDSGHEKVSYIELAEECVAHPITEYAKEWAQAYLNRTAGSEQFLHEMYAESRMLIDTGQRAAFSKTNPKWSPVYEAFSEIADGKVKGAKR